MGSYPETSIQHRFSLTQNLKLATDCVSEAKRRVEAKYIFKDIQFNDQRRLHKQGLRST